MLGPMRYLALIAAATAWLTAFGGCDRAADPQLMADQVARLNREVARLDERLSVLEQRASAHDGVSAAHTADGDADGASKGDSAAGEAAASDDAPAAPTIVTITIDDALRLNDEVLPQAALGARLRALVAAEPALQLVIRVGAEVPHERVVSVLDLARASGIDAIALAPDE
ncbi:MAG: hypothetical protein Tsb0020_45680 [Haliangiales bacterium]